MKPNGKWKCRACGSIWDGSQLFADPMSTALKWTCGDLTCGGVCDRAEVMSEQGEMIAFYECLDKIKKGTGADDVWVQWEDAGLVFRLDWNDDYHVRWFIRIIDLHRFNLDYMISETVRKHKYRINS